MKKNNSAKFKLSKPQAGHINMRKIDVKVHSKCWIALCRTDFPLWGNLITVDQKYLEITNAVLLYIYYKVLYREREERWSLLLAETHFSCNCSAVTFATKHKNTINVIYWERFLTYLFYPWTLNKDSCLPLCHYTHPLRIKIQ